MRPLSEKYSSLYNSIKDLLQLAPLLFIVFSCVENTTIEHSTDKHGHSVIKEYYSDGQLKMRKTIIDSTQNEFVVVHYDEDGKLLDSTTYIDGKIQGIRKYFESETDLLHIEEYKNDVVHGIDKAIYKNGVSSFEGQRDRGVQVGEWRFFYPEGNMITYEYYDDNGNIEYFQKYDEDNHLLITRGNAIIKVKLTPGVVFSNDSVTLKAETANPPNSNVTVNVKLLDKNNNPLYQWSFENVNGNFISFTFAVTDPGKYNFHFEWTITGLKDDYHDKGTLTKSITAR